MFGTPSFRIHIIGGLKHSVLELVTRHPFGLPFLGIIAVPASSLSPSPSLPTISHKSSAVLGNIQVNPVVAPPLGTMSTLLAPPLNSPTPFPYPQPQIDHLNQPPRRIGPDQRIRRPSSHVTPGLDSVPEDPLSHVNRASSSTASRLSEKGKERDSMSAPLSRNDSGHALPAKRKRAEWVVDLVETRERASAWSERERVILVIGSEPRFSSRSSYVYPVLALIPLSADPTADALTPILYDPVFASTLLLVGSTEPSPSIEALLSPSHLLPSRPDRGIYPILHTFTIPPGIDGAHSLPSLLAQANSLAQQFRTRSTPSSSWTRRRGLSDSALTSTLPLTPPTRGRTFSSLGSYQGSPRGSYDSKSDDFSPSPSNPDTTQRPEIRKSSSGLSLNGMRDSLRPPARSRLSSSFSSNNLFAGLPKLSDVAAPSTPVGGSPFDAVINIMPRATEFAPERALQDMLHQAVVLTTGVLPVISRTSAKPSAGQPLQISLLHVLPSQVPVALPQVIESFLLSLLPSFAYRGDRELWTSVVTTPAWQANNVDDVAQGSISDASPTGAKTLLFGGLRCPVNLLQNEREAARFKPRAFLSSWGACIPMPGLLSEAGRSSTASQLSVDNRRPSYRTQISADTQQLFAGTHRASMTRSAPSTRRVPSEPISIAYSDTKFRNPPSTNQRTFANAPFEPPRLCPDSDSPSTPELNTSHSSCSSWSGVGEISSSDQSEAKSIPQVQITEKGKKGFSSWFKSRTKVMKV